MIKRAAGMERNVVNEEHFTITELKSNGNLICAVYCFLKEEYTEEARKHALKHYGKDFTREPAFGSEQLGYAAVVRG